MDPPSDSDSEDGQGSHSYIDDLEPYDWKEEASRNLLHIFRAAAARQSSDVDLGPLTPAIQDVISTALSCVEERVLRYAEHVTHPARRNRGAGEAKFILDMEKSVKRYFEEKLQFAGHEDTEECSPPEPEGDEADLHIRALTKCHTFMVDQLIVKGSGLVDHMIQWKLISEARGDAILKKETDLERSRDVLRLAASLTGLQFKSFLTALENTNKHVAEKLVSTMGQLRETPKSDSVHVCGTCPIRGRIDLATLADSLLEKKLIPRDFHNDLCKETMSSVEAWKQLFGHAGHTQRLLPVLHETYPAVVEEMERRGLSSLECSCLRPTALLAPSGPSRLSDDTPDVGHMSDVASILYPKKATVKEYPMTSSRRGLCLAVENSVFTEKRSRKCYEGSTTLIQEEFRRLGFQIIKRSNLSAKELMEEARRIAALDHSQHSCFACVIRSRHEGSENILCTDGGTVAVQDLMDVFSASHCPTLAGKPKVFYMPKSRGSEKQGGITTPGENGEENHPDGADFLLIQTAPSGFVQCGDNLSLGVPVHLKMLAGVLQRHGHTQDFMTCLAMANREYSGKKRRSGPYHTATVTSTLRKALVFRELP